MKKAMMFAVALFFLISVSAFGTDKTVSDTSKKSEVKTANIQAGTEKVTAEKKAATDKKAASRSALFFLFLLGRNAQSSR